MTSSRSSDRSVSYTHLTIREISRITGMPQGTVSVYLRRAVGQLRVLLKEESL